MSNFGALYALALLAATPVDMLVHPQKPRRIRGLDADKMTRMEAEMEGVQRDFQIIEDGCRAVCNIFDKMLKLKGDCLA